MVAGFSFATLTESGDLSELQLCPWELPIAVPYGLVQWGPRNVPGSKYVCALLPPCAGVVRPLLPLPVPAFHTPHRHVLLYPVPCNGLREQPLIFAGT